MTTTAAVQLLARIKQVQIANRLSQLRKEKEQHVINKALTAK